MVVVKNLQHTVQITERNRNSGPLVTVPFLKHHVVGQAYQPGPIGSAPVSGVDTTVVPRPFTQYYTRCALPRAPAHLS